MGRTLPLPDVNPSPFKASIMTSTIHKTLITKCVLFDMDGTLIDTTPLVEKHWRSFADEHCLDAEKVNVNSFSLPYELQ